MCGICGCSESDTNREHHSNHEAMHAHNEKMLHVEQAILSNNHHLGLHNNDYFTKKKILTLNVMSSPGSGKTTLLAKTISDLKQEINMAVIVGDQQTDYDANMLKSNGAQSLQINTGRGCHLDAHMVSHAVEQLDLNEQSVLFIENIGNLVCPALFNLGEHYKVVMLSVTEGDNKPLKYPDMFHSADLLIITKSDLLPYVEFDLNQCMEYARRIKPDITILVLSTTKADGLTDWYEWIKNGIQTITHDDHRASSRRRI